MEKAFDEWNEKKRIINKKQFRDFVHEREVWWSSIGLNVGVEADGKHENFERPVLVLRKFSKDAVLAVALTSRPKRTRFHYCFQHEGQEYAAVLSQIRLMSTKRLLRRMYVMDERIFEPIKDHAKNLI